MASEAHLSTLDGECCVATLRSEGSPRFTPSEKISNARPVSNATRAVAKVSRNKFFDFWRNKSPGCNTRATIVGTHVAAATESVKRNACSSVPRKSWRTKYLSQNINKVAGTTQYASAVATTVSSTQKGERPSRIHRKCLLTNPIKYHGPSFSSVCPSLKTAGSPDMLPHKRSSKK